MPCLPAPPLSSLFAGDTGAGGGGVGAAPVLRPPTRALLPGRPHHIIHFPGRGGPLRIDLTHTTLRFPPASGCSSPCVCIPDSWMSGADVHPRTPLGGTVGTLQAPTARKQRGAGRQMQVAVGGETGVGGGSQPSPSNQHPLGLDPPPPRVCPREGPAPSCSRSWPSATGTPTNPPSASRCPPPPPVPDYRWHPTGKAEHCGP